MHIEAISNGLGAPSMLLMVLAGEGKIPATVSITADTGFEKDRVWSTGRRSTALEYFEEVTVPLAARYGIAARFVRAQDKDGQDMPSLEEHTEQMIALGKLNSIKMPLFGSRGGRLQQPCTSRFKVAAIRQELRRLGATTARSAQRLHRDEIHRMKGANPRVEGGFWTWNDMDGNELQDSGLVQGGLFGETVAVQVHEPRIVQWASHYYPHVEANVSREDIRQELEQRAIPYLESSECDGCPHQNLTRWQRHTPQRLQELATLEAKMNGEYFFTSLRIPLLEALDRMQSTPDAFADVDFGCNNAVCDV